LEEMLLGEGGVWVWGVNKCGGMEEVRGEGVAIDGEGGEKKMRRWVAGEEK
jgi:hypothetical protein